MAVFVPLIRRWGRDKERFCPSNQRASKFYVHMSESLSDLVKMKILIH